MSHRALTPPLFDVQGVSDAPHDSLGGVTARGHHGSPSLAQILEKLASNEKIKP
jgi:hypothetical protein